MLLKLSPFVLAALVLISCNRISDKEVRFYAELNATLSRSNEAIESSTRARLISLEDKSVNPASSEKAKSWLSHAEEIRKITLETYTYIEGLKSWLGTLARRDNKNTKAVNKFFTDEKNNELTSKLITCKIKLLNADPAMDSTLKNDMPLLQNSKSVTIKDIPVVIAINQLNKLQLDLKLSENMLITYCDRKISVDYVIYNHDFPFAYTNSLRFLPGEKAIVTAGVGSISTRAVPDISVNGHTLQRTSEGTYTYTFNTSNKPGSYEALVLVTYFDPNTGQQATLKKIIKYEVIPKCPE